MSDEEAIGYHREGMVDPAAVQTLPELANALNSLRGSRSYAQLDKVLNPRASGPRVLPASTVSNLLSGTSMPNKDTLMKFLTACGLGGQAQEPWLRAWERVATRHLRQPEGAVRVRDARPRLLGVHASIQVDRSATDLPVYVPRDLDADLRAAITVAANEGGFVLLIGDSSVGKTRALFEAVRATLPEWWIIHPADAAKVHQLAAEPISRTVVWLDELQNYLSEPAPVTAASVRALVTAGVVVLATLWPAEYTARTAPRAPGKQDPHADERQLLGLAYAIQVPEALSEGERSRAEALASDQRIRVALDTTDAGFTQVLAAGPELVRRWENADPCSKAVITCALDARRVGVGSPLSRELLAAAAPGYLTSAQQATAPPNWLDHALAHAMTLLRGATAVLNPVAAGMGTIAGFVVADYLDQHARRVRRTTPLPDTAWQALVKYHHPHDTKRLAISAQRRMRLEYAEALYRRATASGDRDAARRLAGLLAEHGRVDEAISVLRPRADVGDSDAARKLDNLLAQKGRLDELRSRADAGDGYAARWLADLLVRQGQVDDAVAILRVWAGKNDSEAMRRLADLLAKQGKVDELLARANSRYTKRRLTKLLAELEQADELRSRADAGDRHAARWLANLLAKKGHVDELRSRAGAGDRFAARRLADLLTEQGQVDDAVAVLRDLGSMGDRSAVDRLAALQAKHGRIDEAIVVLRPRADTGHSHTARWLADLLVEQGHVDDAIVLLRFRADSGDQQAARQLANLLADQGHTDELWSRANAGDGYSARGLAQMLVRQGQIDDALALLRRRANSGDHQAARQLANLVVQRRRIDDAVTLLRDWAGTGDPRAAGRLLAFLVRQDRVAELEAEVHAGTPGAAEHMRHLTQRRGKRPRGGRDHI